MRHAQGRRLASTAVSVPDARTHNRIFSYVSDDCTASSEKDIIFFFNTSSSVHTVGCVVKPIRPSNSLQVNKGHLGNQNRVPVSPRPHGVPVVLPIPPVLMSHDNSTAQQKYI